MIAVIFNSCNTEGPNCIQSVLLGLQASFMLLAFRRKWATWVRTVGPTSKV